ncbi:SusC/RagA family TonB-linked outer membrane protein [Niabella ginsengisoli]|uniref:SusC/RagA family TonB-linked outer membrane protein n=1 Tax=Niabella ginsengisoli TaxID=522298 RepID=A0ABS9SKV7_9BACT|nr:SusC/RagA family TonB-linked outer membrane protein [Niabella ginsengisoli]MCH5599011.1 SusC/RagA family TonB-linked outer membrane protein [Niabella ginsengisoli]
MKILFYTMACILTVMYCSQGTVFAQDHQVTGTVVGNNKQLLQGVTVQLKNTSKTTITNEQGSFSINALATDTLQLSFVGYNPKELPINGLAIVSVQLEPSNTDLSEVVVVGYGSQQKRNLTGAISAVSGDVLKDRPIPNIGQGLQGVIPNLNITNSSGKLGQAPDFNVRGFGSINGGDPLFVVDGVPLNNPSELTRLNPQDVESISVLKDAASSAIYGGRAAFGVVLITTKSGKYNSGVTVQFSSNYSVKKITQLPEVITDPATVIKYRNLGYSSYYGTNMPGYTQQMIDYANQRSQDPSLPPYYLNPSDPTQYVYVGNTNWFDELYRATSPTWENNLSVGGGSDKVKYNLSLGYINQQGILEGKNDEWNRYSMRGKIEFKATKWLKFGNTTQIGRVVNEYPTYWNGPSRGDIYHDIGRNPSLNILKTLTEPGLRTVIA